MKEILILLALIGFFKSGIIDTSDKSVTDPTPYRAGQVKLTKAYKAEVRKYQPLLTGMCDPERMDIPEGLLWGIFKERTRRLDPDNTHELTGKPRIALDHLCSQVYRGKPLCNPEDVEARINGGVGPLAIRPVDAIHVAENGHASWTRLAQDADYSDPEGGVLNILMPEDSLAFVALQLKAHFNEVQAKSSSKRWELALYSFYQASGYSGINREEVAIRHWNNWAIATSDS